MGGMPPITSAMKRLNKKLKTRSKLLSTAAREFARLGYAKTNINEVSIRAGFGKGTIYNYFENKFDLLLAVFKKTIDDLVIEIKTQSAGIDSPLQKLEKGIYAYFHYFNKNKALTNLIIRECFAAEPKKQKEFIQAGSPVIELIMSYLRAGIESNLCSEDTDPFVSTLLLVGMVENLILMQQTLNATLGTPDELAKTVVTSFIYGIEKKS